MRPAVCLPTSLTVTSCLRVWPWYRCRGSCSRPCRAWHHHHHRPRPTGRRRGGGWWTWAAAQGSAGSSSALTPACQLQLPMEGQSVSESVSSSKRRLAGDSRTDRLTPAIPLLLPTRASSAVRGRGLMLGVDLSPKMAALATQTGAYDHVKVRNETSTTTTPAPPRLPGLAAAAGGGRARHAVCGLQPAAGPGAVGRHLHLRRAARESLPPRRQVSRPAHPSLPPAPRVLMPPPPLK